MEDLVKSLWPPPQKIVITSGKMFSQLSETCSFHVSLLMPFPNDFHLSFLDLFKVWTHHEVAFHQLGLRIVFETTATTTTTNISTGNCDHLHNGHVLVDGQGSPLNVQNCLIKCCVNPIFFSNQTQSYRILVGDSIQMFASDIHGLHYSLLTLVQMVKFSKTSPIPYLTVEDCPSFLRRGFDVTNLMKSVKWPVLPRILELLALLRINQIFFQLVYEQDKDSVLNLKDSVDLMDICWKHFMDVCPVYEIGKSSSQTFLLSSLKSWILSTQKYFPRSKVIYFGKRLSKILTEDLSCELRPFLDQVAPNTPCFFDVQENHLPFGSTMMSSREVPTYQLYRILTLDTSSVSGNLVEHLANVKGEVLDVNNTSGIVFMFESDVQFYVPTLFELPLIVLSAGYLWNQSSTRKHINECDLASNFIKVNFLKSPSSTLASLVIDMSQIESDVHPLVFQLLSDPDSVQLSSIESLSKASKQIRSVKQELMELNCDGDTCAAVHLEEVSFVCDLIQFTLKLGRSLCLAGRNPDKVGLSLVNLGINNLSAPIKTDLANTLLGVMDRMKTALSANHTQPVISHNVKALRKLLEALYPEQPGHVEQSQLQFSTLYSSQLSTESV